MGKGGDWVGTELILGFPKKRKFSCSCRESNHYVPGSVITRQTELHRHLLCLCDNMRIGHVS